MVGGVGEDGTTLKHKCQRRFRLIFRCRTIDVVSIRATLDKSVSALSVAFRLSVSFSQIELVNREQMD